MVSIVTDFRSMQLFQTKYFRSSSVPCTCSRLPFHAAVPDKVFRFQCYSMHLFQNSSPCSCPDKVFLFKHCSMHLFQTSVPCICSRLLFHASVPDFRSMHLFQTSVPCICSRLLFQSVFHSIFHSNLCSIPYSIPCSVPGFSNRHRIRQITESDRVGPEMVN